MSRQLAMLDHLFRQSLVRKQAYLQASLQVVDPRHYRSATVAIVRHMFHRVFAKQLG